VCCSAVNRTLSSSIINKYRMRGFNPSNEHVMHIIRMVYKKLSFLFFLPLFLHQRPRYAHENIEKKQDSTQMLMPYPFLNTKTMIFRGDVSKRSLFTLLSRVENNQAELFMSRFLPSMPKVLYRGVHDLLYLARKYAIDMLYVLDPRKY
jgi:hypothetical protein